MINTTTNLPELEDPPAFSSLVYLNVCSTHSHFNRNTSIPPQHTHAFMQLCLLENQQNLREFPQTAVYSVYTQQVQEKPWSESKFRGRQYVVDENGWAALC